MGCMVLCRTFHTAPEQGQGLTPIVPIVLVSVPVPVLDTASVLHQEMRTYYHSATKPGLLTLEQILARFITTGRFCLTLCK